VALDVDVTERIDTEQALAPLLAEARRLAAERGAPVLVSWSERVAAEDPIDAFAQAAGASDRCLWLQPEAGFALVGIGAAYVIEPTGSDRFAAADAAWRALLDGALIVGDGPGPAVIGGFAFDPERPATPRWHGFPDARLILPRQTLTLQGSECWRRVNVVVGGHYPSPPGPLSHKGRGGEEGGMRGGQYASPSEPVFHEERGGEGRGVRGERPDRWEISEDVRRRMVEVARHFRKASTPSEALLWEALRGRRIDGIKFRRQQPIGPFVVDFYAPEKRLVVEVDGGVHATQVEHDRERQELLETLGLRFLRVPAELVERDLAAVLQTIRTALAQAVPPSPLVGEGGRGVRGFLTAVSEAAAAVRRGELEKVVLAREVRVEAEEPFDVEAALRRLRDAYPSCYVFAVARGEQVFLGATPERLVRLEGRTVRVASLAGSIRRGTTPEEDRELAAALLASTKDRAEHAVVARAIRAALDGPCVEVEAPDAPVILSVRNVHHLYTPVNARLSDGATLLDLVARLHPTPAVGGMPRAAALRYIREHEGLDRGWYAAPVGWMDASGQGEFAVALRSALVEGAEATLFAGCGIMGDSDPEREYAESAVKLRPMLAALGIEGTGTE